MRIQMERSAAMETNANHENSDYPQDQEEFLHQIHQEWNRLMHIIQEFGEDEMTTPLNGGWSVKDHLAHISTWERYLCKHHLGQLPAHEVLGMEIETYQNADEDRINDFIFKRQKDFDLIQILSELFHTHQSMLSDLEQLSFSELMKPRYKEDPDARPLLWWVIANTSDHYEEHRLSIERSIR
jgi:hypothetical protein